MKNHKRLQFPLPILVLISIILNVASVHADDDIVIDQQQTNVHDDWWYTGIGPGQNVAQIFTPGLTGYLEKISVLLNKSIGFDPSTGEPIHPGDIIAEARRTNIGIACLSGCYFGTTTTILPSEQVLASSVLPEPEITEHLYQWYEVYFDKPAFFCGEVPYALVLGTNEVWQPGTLDPYITLGFYRWPEDADHIRDPYPRGHLMGRTPEAGGMWSVNNYWNQDTAFITYMKIVESPSLGALSAGFGIAECGQTDPCCGDFDSDGDVDGMDLAILIQQLYGGGAGTSVRVSISSEGVQ